MHAYLIVMEQPGRVLHAQPVAGQAALTAVTAL